MGVTMGKQISATVALWLIAMMATLFVVRDSGKFTYLAPVFFVCLMGSIMVVRSLGAGKHHDVS